MRIAILGGAFNPPHVGHYLVAEQVRELLHMDEVWLMPCFSHAFHKRMVPFEHRFAMTSLLSNGYLKVSDFEKTKNPSSRTVETLRLLTIAYPRHEFSWIVGSDQLATFRKWHDWRDLVTRYRIIIFPRDLYRTELEREVREAFGFTALPPNITVLGSKHLITSTISSTEIRTRIQAGHDVRSLVQPEVEAYIRKHSLYHNKII